MKPPMDIDSIKGCIHLVAQLPFAKDSQAFVGSMDIWCDACQIWEMIAGDISHFLIDKFVVLFVIILHGVGDEEEHATLLFNYLHYLLVKAKGEVISLL